MQHSFVFSNRPENTSGFPPLEKKDPFVQPIQHGNICWIGQVGFGAEQRHRSDKTASSSRQRPATPGQGHRETDRLTRSSCSPFSAQSAMIIAFVRDPEFRCALASRRLLKVKQALFDLRVLTRRRKQRQYYHTHSGGAG